MCTLPRYEFETWHSPPYPNVDICFIHGRLGDREQARKSKGAGQPWPQALLPVIFQHARILSFGFDCESLPSGAGFNAALGTLADDLNWSLVECRDTPQYMGLPVIFVAHGLGGLICKKAVHFAFHSVDLLVKDISSCLLGVIFMGTPHAGPVLAEPRRPLMTESSEPTATIESHDSLTDDKETATKLNSDFIYAIDSIDSKRQIPIYCEDTESQEDSKELIVSSPFDVLAGYEVQSVNATHSNVAKFEYDEDPGFMSICTILRYLLTSDRARAFASLHGAHRDALGFELGTQLAQNYINDRRLSQNISLSSSSDSDQGSIAGQELSSGDEHQVLSSAEQEHTADLETADLETADSAMYYPEVQGNSALAYGSVHTYQDLSEDSLERTSIHRPFPAVPHVSRGTAPSRRIAHLHFDPYPPLAGREEVIQKLQSLFFYKKSRSVALWGLGGVGLTKIANAFAHWVKDSRPESSVIWLPATSMAAFARAYADVATILGPNITGVSNAHDNLPLDSTSTLEKIRDYINSDTTHSYIFVLDNAHDRDLVCGNSIQDGLSPYLPQCPHVQILITTRTFAVAKLLAVDHIEVGALTPEQALVMARRLLARKWTHLVGPDDTTIRCLLEELQLLPLAISQAMACMAYENMPAGKCLDGVRGLDPALRELVSKQRPDRNRYEKSAHAIATTWFSSFAYLAEKHKAAAQLLKFLSQLEWGRVPISLLPSLLADSIAIRPLVEYNFVSQELDTLLMHKMVHAAAADWSSERGPFGAVLRSALDEISIVYPHPTFANKDKWEYLVPHVKHLLGRANDMRITPNVPLYTKLMTSLCIGGNFKDAVRYGEICRTSQSHGHLRSVGTEQLNFEIQLAFAYSEDGQLPEAIELFEHIVKVQETTLPNTSCDRLVSEHHLAYTYLRQGRLRKTLQLFAHVVEIRRSILRETSYDRLTSEHNYAYACQKSGRLQKAIQLFEHVVEIRQAILPENDSVRLMSEHNLAHTYQKNGQFQKAIQLYKHVVEIRQAILAENDFARLLSEYNLAQTYQKNGQFQKAIQLYKHVVKIRQDTLPETDSHRLTAEHNLAFSYYGDGEFDEAVRLYEHVVKVRRNILPETDSIRLSTEHNLAHAYLENGQFQDAIELLEQIIDIRRGILPEVDFHRLTSEHSLALAYYGDGQFYKAMQLFEHVVKVRRNILPETDDDLLHSLYRYSQCLVSVGRIREAKKTIRQVVTIAEKCVPTSENVEDYKRLLQSFEDGAPGS